MFKARLIDEFWMDLDKLYLIQSNYITAVHTSVREQLRSHGSDGSCNARTACFVSKRWTSWTHLTGGYALSGSQLTRCGAEETAVMKSGFQS